MNIRELAVPGAFEFVPEVFPDSRGSFVSPLQSSAFHEALGTDLFVVRQVSWSRSRCGVVRGVHFTVTPPGCAKYVFCPEGSALDTVVDLRTGSPAFGRSESVELDAIECRGLYLPVGVGHAFQALTDDTVVCYLLSAPYDRANELAVDATDPTIALPMAPGSGLLLSDRDLVAPTLRSAAELGMLPEYATSRALDEALRRAARGG